MDINKISNITSKVLQKGVENVGSEKSSEVSKFEQIRMDKLNKEMEVTGLKMEDVQFKDNILTKSDIKNIERDFKAELEKRGEDSGGEILKEKINSLKAKMESVAGKIHTVDKSQFSEAVNNYFSETEKRFSKLSNIVKNLESGNNKYSMKDLLKIQFEIQTVTQNVELLSKIVDQVSSGLKTIMQTQV